MLPNDISSLYDWTPAAKQSYADFLRARQLESKIRYAIDSQDRELIATREELAEHGIEVLSVNLERGFTLLEQNLGQVVVSGPEAGAENTAAFNWGFCDALISQGQMNIPLDEFIKLTKTSSQTWACEQFELGRDEFRRQLYKEALQSATRAMDGQGSNQGNKTEFRFHFLAGLVRLGSYRNTSPELLNPQLAQIAFLAAARYAESIYPADAGQALICAGRAALVAGEIEEAITHTRKGLHLAPNHAAGMYQLARALFLKGTRNEAADRLTDAILLNVEQALHASGDPDFIAKTDFLTGVMRQAHERCEAHYRQVAERYRRALQTLQNYSFMDVSAEALQLKGLAEIQQISQAAESLAASKTLFAYAAATKHYLNGFLLFPACFEAFKAHCIRHLTQKITKPPRREDYLPANWSDNPQGVRGTSKAGLVSGIVSGVTVFLFESSQMARPIYRGILESMSELFLIPLLAAFGIAAVVAVGEDIYREYVRSKYKSAGAAFDAAWFAYTNLKNSLQNEIATIQGMSLPKECAPPATAITAKPVLPNDGSAPQKRGSAWSKL